MAYVGFLFRCYSNPSWERERITERTAAGRIQARARGVKFGRRTALTPHQQAEALGVSRRMVAYYSNGEKKVPKPILLACRGWEVGAGLYQAA